MENKVNKSDAISVGQAQSIVSQTHSPSGITDPGYQVVNGGDSSGNQQQYTGASRQRGHVDDGEARTAEVVDFRAKRNEERRRLAEARRAQQKAEREAAEREAAGKSSDTSKNTETAKPAVTKLDNHPIVRMMISEISPDETQVALDGEVVPYDDEPIEAWDEAIEQEKPPIDPPLVEQQKQALFAEMDRVKRFRKADEFAWENIIILKERKKSQDQILKEMREASTDQYQRLESPGMSTTAYPSEEIFENIPVEERTREDEIEYDRHIKYREKTKDAIKYPWTIKIEGESVDVIQEPKRRGAGVYARKLTKRCEDNLRLLREAWGEGSEFSISDAMRIVLIRGGITFDTNGNIGGKPAKDFVLPEETLVRLCRDALLSMKINNGNPFGMVPGEQPMMYGTRCYPLGYCPSFMIQKMKASKKSPWHSRSMEEIQQQIGDEWLRNTLPTMVAYTEHNGSDGLSQRYTLYEGMCALLSLDGMANQARAWGITTET
ncbi:hypothetical protein [Adlercreutzia sp. ZJ138]|uniref:hypothetical protein n=1 Tax=Adlercreutzia sp. ZJ138 TaxID=2709405 RepID=UPI0013ED2745|nr:hypothetical protein [Adlercreutzia sp. ZJ138]